MAKGSSRRTLSFTFYDHPQLIATVNNAGEGRFTVLGQETEPSLRSPVDDDGQQLSIPWEFNLGGRTDATGALMCGHHASRDGSAFSSLVTPIHHWLHNSVREGRRVAKRPARRLAAASGTGTRIPTIQEVRLSVIDNRFSDSALAGAIQTHETLLSRTAFLMGAADQRRSTQVRISALAQIIIGNGWTA
ncbi:hypothetical protein BC827DRAFT_1154305 [Russula dissimulans]|nr:hypothetical protein BC827DRAFT_1154305 [Russula dissimulans]